MTRERPIGGRRASMTAAAAGWLHAVNHATGNTHQDSAAEYSELDDSDSPRSVGDEDWTESNRSSTKAKRVKGAQRGREPVERIHSPAVGLGCGTGEADIGVVGLAFAMDTQSLGGHGAVGSGGGKGKAERRGKRKSKCNLDDNRNEASGRVGDGRRSTGNVYDAGADANCVFSSGLLSLAEAYQIDQDARARDKVRSKPAQAQSSTSNAFHPDVRDGVSPHESRNYHRSSVVDPPSRATIAWRGSNQVVNGGSVRRRADALKRRRVEANNANTSARFQGEGAGRDRTGDHEDGEGSGGVGPEHNANINEARVDAGTRLSSGGNGHGGQGGK
ncbi:unnamed protein product [Choristocarpus tenellus]